MPFLKLKSSLSSNFCSLLFHQIFLMFSDFFPFFLSYCKTVLKVPPVSETSSYFLVRFQGSFVNPKWRCFNVVSLGSDSLRKKGCQKGTGILTPRTPELGPWHLGLAILRPRILIAGPSEFVTQNPSIPTRTTDCVNFNCEANFDNKKLGHLCRKLRSRVDRPKHLPIFFYI